MTDSNDVNRQNADRPRYTGHGLADRMRLHTEALHRRAERSGVLHELLQGEASYESYSLFLRNLLPVYCALETALEQHRCHRAIRSVVSPALYRAPAIESDLESLYGPGWFTEMPVVPAASRYAARIEGLADAASPGLIAHAYTRFLGDLNGGRVLRNLLVRSLQLGPEALSFYDYPGLDVGSFRGQYRAMIDGAGREVPDIGAVMDEAAIAFRLNIDLSEAIARMTH